MKLTLAEMIEATGGHLIQGRCESIVEGISTDSRTIHPGEFYIPLKGPHFDGHDFIEKAFMKGASGAMSAGPTEGPWLKKRPSLNLVRVGDTLKALGDLARFWRRRFKIPVVAVTGSCGKTSTKELISSCLSRVGPVCKTEGNLNNLVGLPISILRMNEDHLFGVFEMGMNAFGEIGRLTEITSPTMGLITNVGAAHLEGVGDLAGVARAKSELFSNLGSGDTAIVNLDDPYIAEMKTRACRVTFGLSKKASVYCRRIKYHREAIELSIEDGNQSPTLNIPVLGEYFIKNILAAYTVLFRLNVPLDEISGAFQDYRLTKGRGEVIILDKNILVVDDSYNANPHSMSAALNALNLRFPRRRRLAVLGEMRELGDRAATYHQELGEQAREAGVDALFALGLHSDRVIAGFLFQKGVHRGKSFHDLKSLEEGLVGFVKGGDVILVKGSRDAHMERVVAFLKEAYAKGC